jgi:hypothetical protein
MLISTCLTLTHKEKKIHKEAKPPSILQNFFFHKHDKNVPKKNLRDGKVRLISTSLSHPNKKKISPKQKKYSEKMVRDES